MDNYNLKINYNKTNKKYKTLKTSLINIINKEKDLKQVKKAYRQLNKLKKIQGIHPDKQELLKIKKEINNDDIFNICLLLVFN